MEQAYLNLAKIYSQKLGRKDLARYVYEKFLKKFPKSEQREFVEKRLFRGM
jgi:TolA-binding protein